MSVGRNCIYSRPSARERGLLSASCPGSGGFGGRGGPGAAYRRLWPSGPGDLGAGSPCFSREPGLSNLGAGGDDPAAPPCLPGPRPLIVRGRHSRVQYSSGCKADGEGSPCPGMEALHTPSSGYAWTSPQTPASAGLCIDHGVPWNWGLHVSPALTPIRAGTWMRQTYRGFVLVRVRPPSSTFPPP